MVTRRLLEPDPAGHESCPTERWVRLVVEMGAGGPEKLNSARIGMRGIALDQPQVGPEELEPPGGRGDIEAGRQ
jgi:hypothetical protein